MNLYRSDKQYQLQLYMNGRTHISISFKHFLAIEPIEIHLFDLYYRNHTLSSRSLFERTGDDRGIPTSLSDLLGEFFILHLESVLLLSLIETFLGGGFLSPFVILFIIVRPPDDLLTYI